MGNPNREVAEAAQSALIVNSPTKLEHSSDSELVPENSMNEEIPTKIIIGKPAHPWFKIWIKPRETIREIIDFDPTYLVFPLALFTGLARVVDRAMSRNMGDRYDLGFLILFSIVAGPLVGIVSIYIGGSLFSWMGKYFGGQGSTKEVRAALAWSAIPAILIVFLDFGDLVLFRIEEFSIYTPNIDPIPEGSSSTIVLIGILWFVLSRLRLAILIWSAVLSIKCLAEAHRFSTWRSLVTILIPLTILLVLGFVLLAPILLSNQS